MLIYAAGRCEGCGSSGFKTLNGIYLETHHVIALNEKGRDATTNVAALCPNCHRMAHYSVERKAIRDELLRMAQARLAAG